MGNKTNPIFIFIVLLFIVAAAVFFQRSGATYNYFGGGGTLAGSGSGYACYTNVPDCSCSGSSCRHYCIFEDPSWDGCYFQATTADGSVITSTNYGPIASSHYGCYIQLANEGQSFSGQDAKLCYARGGVSAEAAYDKVFIQQENLMCPNGGIGCNTPSPNLILDFFQAIINFIRGIFSAFGL